jgi:ATP-dependent DNA ligase
VLQPPVEPMLAKLVDEIPEANGFLFEPKWDGFRSIVFRSNDDVYIQSRDLKPLDRYFPELHAALLERLPAGCVVDGEIVIATGAGLDFDALQLRLHPAASRVEKLSKASPSSFVAFDLLAEGSRSIMELPQRERRARLETMLRNVSPPVYLTPVTRDRTTAVEWLKRFEGAGLDGVIAKPEAAAYQPGKRSMLKIKHARTADCVVAGFRWLKPERTLRVGVETGAPNARTLRVGVETGGLIGSLLLGLFDDQGTLHHVGVTSSFTMTRRKELAEELEPLRQNALADHPWKAWADYAKSDAAAPDRRMPGGYSRWSAGKDLSWEPVRAERVCEVKYDHMQGDRFRHAATFLRWREDKTPKDCTYEQLEVIPAFELSSIFGATPPG